MKLPLLLRMFVSFVLSLSLLCGCAPAPVNTDGGSDLPSAEDPVLFRDGKTDYRIVYPASLPSEERRALTGLKNHIKTVCGADLPVVPDTEAPTEKEILWGITNRAPSLAAAALLADDADFILTVSGSSLVVAWRTEYASRLAADHIKTLCGTSSEWVFSAEAPYVGAEHRNLPSPVSRFSFEEGTGTVTADAVTGKTATLVKSGWGEGVCGTGLYLNDASSGYLDLGKGYFSDLCKGSDAVTISLWVMAYQNRSSRLFSFYSDRTVTASYCLYQPGGLYFYARSTPSEKLKREQYIYDAGSKYITGTNSTETNEGIWQHLTFVMDFASGEIALYLNGEALDGAKGYTKGFASQALVTAAATLADGLGGDPTGESFSFCGILDEFTLYNTRLSDEQILLLYHCNTDTNSPTVKQAKLESLSKNFRRAYILAADAPVYCYQQRQYPLDPQNSSAVSGVKDGVWYVPAAFAEEVFGGEALKGASPGAEGYPLAELCKKADKALWTGVGGKIAMILTGGTPSETEEKDLAVMYEYLTERSYALPTTDAESTRVVVADNSKDSDIKHCFSPYVIKIGDAIYVTMDTHTRATLVFRSDDGGKTFHRLSRLSPLAGASLFEAGGNLYLLGMTGKESTEIGVTESKDGGKTWSKITTVPYGVANKYCAPSAVVKANGRVYKAFEGYKTSAWTEDKRTYTVSAPENADLLNPDSWTISTHYSYEIEDLMEQTEPFYTDKAYVQEGCTVLMADGTVRNVLRIDSFPYYGGAASFAVSPDGTTQTYDKNHPLALINLPTGGDLFHIEYDKVSGYYISLINTKTTDHRPYQRNVLALAVSKDMEDWEVVTNLLTDRSVTEAYISMAMRGFQYVSFCFDGEDLLFAVREAGENADNYHDNDLLTFYRLADFRALFTK